MTILITGIFHEPIDSASLVARIRVPSCGAVVVFEGNARSPNEGREVEYLDYETFEERATKQLAEFARETAERHGAEGVVAVHRAGRVAPGEPSVIVAVATPHRAEAFEAARELIDRIKSDAYIWKKEVFIDGEAWV